MGFLEDFWANINAGATTIATAPDPYQYWTFQK